MGLNLTSEKEVDSAPINEPFLYSNEIKRGFNFNVDFSLDEKRISEMNNYGVLPVDVLLEIFQYCSTPEELINIMSCCELFFWILNLNIFWKRYYFHYFFNKKGWNILCSRKEEKNWKERFFLNFSHHQTPIDKNYEKRFIPETYKLGSKENKKILKRIQKMKMEKRRIKLAIIGESDVGKSNFLGRLYYDRFRPFSYYAVPGCDFRVRTFFDLVQAKTLVMELWDTSGQERYRSFVCDYYRKVYGIFYCFSIENRQSFEVLKDYWMQDVLKKIHENGENEEKICGLLVGLKSDLHNAQKREVEIEEAEELVKKNNNHLCGYIENSSKLGENVFSTACILLQRIIEKNFIVEKNNIK